jgi:serine/threonine protein kinase
MMSLPRFPLSHENLNQTISEGIVPELKPSWSGYPAPNNDDPLVGQTLNGTYVVEFALGEGGMGRVYKAHHTRISNKFFAIKVLRSEFSSNREMVARFRREAETAACVTHPNVVEVFDVDETRSNCSYLVCEYLEGIELSEYLKNCGRLEIPTAIHIARQICGGLAAAHAAGVLHRDVKPQNIFVLSEPVGPVSSRPEVKVLDFGLSRFMDSVGTQLTQDGIIMGTPAYMAPEQACGKAVDFRTDVYGVGAVLYSLVTGNAPHPGETLQELLIAVLNQSAPLPRSINPDIPANLELVIQRAMARSPDDRYQSMDELDQALAACEETVATSASIQGSHIWPVARWMPEADARQVNTARPRLVAFGLLAVLLLLIGLASVLPSVELVTGKLRFTRVEVVLILSGIVGTLMTPVGLFFRYLRKSVWASHVKVLDHLRTIQSAMLWGLGTYGAAALATRFLDDVLGRFGAAYLFGRSPGAGFRGWNVLFLLVALGAAGLSIAHERHPKSVQNRTGYWRHALLAAAGSLILTAGIAFGLLWRLQIARHEQALLLGPVSSMHHETVEPPKEVPPSVSEPAPTTPSPSKAIERASADELAQASAKGAQGLIPLSERYPRDSNVLRPLLLAFASRSMGLADAISIMQRLFDVAPEETRDPDFRFLLRKAANTPGETSILAFSTMLEHMGSAGPDQLYELMTTIPRLSKRADELLASDEVQAIASPALRIAYEVRKAPNCAARLPLLDRAAELGDLRTVAILSPLTVGTKRGCGRWKRGPCPAPCAAEAGRYTEAIGRIMARQPGHHY